MMRYLAAVIGMAITAGAPAAQPAPVPTAALLGEVVDVFGQPLSDVEVFIAGTSLSTRTDARGFWIIPSPPRGMRVLGVRKLGYAPVVRAMDVSPMRPDTLPIALRRLPRTLSTVTVSATYRGAALDASAMAERLLQLRVSTGKLYTRDSILARNPQSIVDLLMGIPGIIATREQQGISVVASRAGTGALSVSGIPCPIQFFVNRQAVDIDYVATMSPMQWQSVEVHPITSLLSGLPAMSGTCGAVVITLM
jgi:Carboxypeptidase regulatory-like domain